MTTNKQYYYFSNEERRLRYDDNREIVLGETHTVNCQPILCTQGLHASKRIIDALLYAPSPQLYIVELGGKVVHGKDKSCATSRKYIRHIDTTEQIKAFARKQALINVEKIKPYCTDEDYEVILRWLNEGDEKDIRISQIITSSVIDDVKLMGVTKPVTSVIAASSSIYQSTDPTDPYSMFAAALSSANSISCSIAFETYGHENHFEARYENYLKAMSDANKMLTDMILDNE